MSLPREQAIGAYLAVRLAVSLFALVAVSQLWPELASGPWPVHGYLLVAAVVPGTELVVISPLAALTERRRPMRKW